jgi:polyadenylate-binding protein
VALAQRKDVRKAQLMAQHAQRLKTGFQANGINVPNVYGAPGAPVFYPQTAQAGNIPQQFMYHQLIQQQRNRGWPQNPQFQPMHNYMVPVRPPRHNARQMPNRGRYNNRNPREQAIPQINQAQSASPQSVTEQPGVGGVVGTVEPLALTPSLLEQYTREQQSSIIGERLFGLISKLQPEWAGKITGMLLDRLNSGARPEELLHLIDDHVALNDKVAEALEVLEAHAMEAQAQDVLKEADVEGEHS